MYEWKNEWMDKIIMGLIKVKEQKLTTNTRDDE